jgi:hypothetical protein
VTIEDRATNQLQERVLFGMTRTQRADFDIRHLTA